jgi:hypothetical protein
MPNDVRRKSVAGALSRQTAVRACGSSNGSLAKGMTKISYSGYRFPPGIIQQAIWLYLRFTLSFRDVEDLLAERGIMVSYCGGSKTALLKTRSEVSAAIFRSSWISIFSNDSPVSPNRTNEPGPASTRMRGAPSTTTRKQDPARPTAPGPPEPSTTSAQRRRRRRHFRRSRPGQLLPHSGGRQAEDGQE